MVNNNFFRSNMRVREISLEGVQKKIAEARFWLTEKNPPFALSELDAAASDLLVLQLSLEKLTEMTAQIQEIRDNANSMMQSMRLRN